MKFSNLWSEAKRDANQERPLAVGYWMGRHHARAAEVPAMIGLCDYEPGNPDNKLDRRPYFVGAIGAVDCDPHNVAGMSYLRPITEAEYRFQVADLLWRKEHAPDEAPKAGKKTDLTKTLPLFPE